MTSIIFCIDLLPLNNTTPIKGLAQEYFYPLSILLNIEYLLCFVKVDTFGLSQIKRKPTNKIKKKKDVAKRVPLQFRYYIIKHFFFSFNILAIYILIVTKIFTLRSQNLEIELIRIGVEEFLGVKYVFKIFYVIKNFKFLDIKFCTN